MTAREIMDRAGLLLSDTAHLRWTEGALLDLVNEARLQVALARPDASTRTEAVLLVPGTAQRLPARGLRLLDVIRNMGTDGATPGSPVRRVDRSLLDALDLAWHAGAGAEVSHYAQDDLIPDRYHVHPGAPGDPALWLEVAYSFAPEALESAGEDMGLAEVYGGPVLDWVLFRAFGADTESRESRERADAHLGSFYQGLNVKTQADVFLRPGQGRTGA